MNVKLVSITKSLITEKELTPEELIVYIARVSNPSNQMNFETSDRLIKYLVKNSHWSPFEMVDMTVDITTSRGIAAQILRHRSFSFQEFSQRYAEVSDFEPIELRKTGATNRQSSLEPFDPVIELSRELISGIDEGCQYTESTKASEIIKNYISEGERLYKNLLQAGVAKECARFVLPLTTQTRIFMKGSIRSWIHYLQIRYDEHTQLEHRLIADQIKKIFVENFPNISTIFND
jgi:thymidylate synthase (FAD)